MYNLIEFSITDPSFNPEHTQEIVTLLRGRSVELGYSELLEVKAFEDDAHQQHIELFFGCKEITKDRLAEFASELGEQFIGPALGHSNYGLLIYCGAHEIAEHITSSSV